MLTAIVENESESCDPTNASNQNSVTDTTSCDNNNEIINYDDEGSVSNLECEL